MASSKGIFSSLENAERKRQARFARARLRAGARERASRVEELYDDGDVDVVEPSDFDQRLSGLLCPLVETRTGEAKVSKGKKLACLNRFVKLWEKKPGEPGATKLTPPDVMLCLRASLTDESMEVRSAALRALRTMIEEEDDVRRISVLNIHYLLARCLDIDLDNKLERVQALRLARKMAFVSPKSFPISVARSLVSIAEGDNKEMDRFNQVCLAALCELSILNSQLFVDCQGVQALTHSLLDCDMPRMAEAVIGSLLRLHNDPFTRTKADVRLDVVVAPFTEFRYIHDDPQPPQPPQQQPQADATAAGGGAGGDARANHPAFTRLGESDRERRYHCGRQALLALARSWCGLSQLTSSPGAVGGDGSGTHRGKSALMALVETLYLPNARIRTLVIEMLSECLGLITFTSDAHESFSSAVNSATSLRFRDSWKLAEGFVAAEGYDLVPRLCRTRPNLTETHRSLLICYLLQSSLPDALVEVIVSSDKDLSIQATLFLGEFMNLVYSFLPTEVNTISGCLPNLMSHVSSSNPVKANHASEAVVALQKFHSHKKRGFMAYSMFLQEILSYSRSFHFHSTEDKLRSHRGKPQNPLESKSASGSLDRVTSAINESCVMRRSGQSSFTSPCEWNWDLVSAIFSWSGDALSTGMDAGGGGSSSAGGSLHYQFVRRVLDFFRPSSNKFARIDLNDIAVGTYTWTGCIMLEFLLKSKSSEARRLLDEFLLEMKNQFQLLIGSKTSSPDCLFSPTRVATTACQFYFLFIGRLSRSDEGRAALDKHHFMQIFLEVLNLRSDMYLKLLISSLDYSSVDWGSRALLTKVCRDGSEAARVYATKFLGLLVRTKTPYITQWGIDLVVGQLFDETSKMIPWLAFDILDEACDDKMNLGAVLSALAPRGPLSPALDDRGVLLTAHFVSSPNGLKILQQTGRLASQLRSWADELNLRYVFLLEGLLNDALTHHQRGEDRAYGTRRSHEAHVVRDAFVPPHLYGHLAATPEGADILSRDSRVGELIQLLSQADPSSPASSEAALLTLKSTVWALCHVAAGCYGARVLGGRHVRDSCVLRVVALAERSPHLELRGTAFFALTLVSTSRSGAALLASVGWCSLRRSRDQSLWPVYEWLHLAHLRAASRRDGGATWRTEEDGKGDEDGKEEEKRPTSPSVIAPFASQQPRESEGSSSSTSKRRRLTKMFRSFSLGTSGRDRKRPTFIRIRTQEVYSPVVQAAHAPSEENTKEVSGQEERSWEGLIEPASKDAEDKEKHAIHESGLGNIDEEVPSANLDELAAANIVIVDKKSQPDGTKEDNAKTIDPPGRLSPIASTTSITEAEDSVKNQDNAKKVEDVTPDRILRIRQRRSGQRAHSESEATNFSVVFEDPSVCTRPGGSDTTSTLPQQVDDTSGGGGGCGRSSSVGQGHSITSMSSVGSWTDSPGYQTLRSLRSRRRPVLSESAEERAQEGGGDAELNAGEAAWARRARTLDFRLMRQQQQQRQRHYQVPRKGQPPLAELRPSDEASEPRYWGICLPLEWKLFRLDDDRTGGVEGPTGKQSPSSLVPVGQCLATTQHASTNPGGVHNSVNPAPNSFSGGLEFHSPSACLCCFRLSPGAGGASDRRRSGSLGAIPRSFQGEESNCESPGVQVVVSADASNGHNMDENGRKAGASLLSLREGGEHVEVRQNDGGDMEKIAQRKEVLKLISCMNASVGVKTAEQGLLRAKQKFPSIFNDLCLYSEVSILLSKYFFRLSTRRFIQELFLNLQYDDLYLEPCAILGIGKDEPKSAKVEKEEEESKQPNGQP